MTIGPTFELHILKKKWFAGTILKSVTNGHKKAIAFCYIVSVVPENVRKTNLLVIF